MNYSNCPACSGSYTTSKEDCRVKTCKRCGAIFGQMTLGDSYNHVLPYFEKEEIEAALKPEQTRYFDFYCTSSQGMQRRHGWYNPATKRITQVG